MNQLTHKEAKRCARACGWKFQRIVGSPTFGGRYDYMGWRVPNISTLEQDLYVRLPLDPYFWFGRLWDKLEKTLRPTKAWSWTLQCEKSLDGQEVTFLVYIEEKDCEYPCPDSGGYKHPCSALRGAIEQLTKAVD